MFFFLIRAAFFFSLMHSASLYMIYVLHPQAGHSNSITTGGVYIIAGTIYEYIDHRDNVMILIPSNGYCNILHMRIQFIPTCHAWAHDQLKDGIDRFQQEKQKHIVWRHFDYVRQEDAKIKETSVYREKNIPIFALWWLCIKHCWWH